MGKLRDLATGYQWQKIPNEVRIAMLEEDARIETLEARIAKADALADCVERDKRSARYEDYHDMLKALAAYREGSDK